MTKHNEIKCNTAKLHALRNESILSVLSTIFNYYEINTFIIQGVQIMTLPTRL
jgi:hypothetical protein